jgi:hypothetical protein
MCCCAETQESRRYVSVSSQLIENPPLAGTSKSQLLKYVHSTASRGIYTSGKGSSGALLWLVKETVCDAIV